MRENSYKDLVSRNFEIEKLIPIKTAGSNGIPYLFYIDHSFDQYRKAQFLRPYITNGCYPWNNSIVYSVHDLNKKWYSNFGLMNNKAINPGLPLNEQIKIIQEERPDAIQGYGSVINLLSAKIIEENLVLPKPRFIFTDSEVLLPEMRRNIEQAFKSEVFDIYGTFETDNIAYECHNHDGYHAAIDSVILEFINENKKAEASKEGEIVVTILNNLAMPFIRYNLHDIGSYKKTTCPCGRSFPLINPVIGRSNDYMITEEGKKLSFFNIANFDRLAPNVKEYQIVQENKNYFNVFVAPGKEYSCHAEKVIAPAIRRFFPKAEININIVSKIERERSGKLRAFKSKVNSE